MKYLYILVSVALSTTALAESTNNKNEWYPAVKTETQPDNNKENTNFYLPPVQQLHYLPVKQPVNNVYPSGLYTSRQEVNQGGNYDGGNHGSNYNGVLGSYLSDVNPSPVANVPQQQYYAYAQPNFVAPSLKYLPVAPQYSHYNQHHHHFIPQMEQIVPTPSTLLSAPYDIGMTGLRFMSKVFNNVHQGTGYLPPTTSGFIPGNEAQNSSPLGNWQVGYSTPAYSQGGYRYDHLYYPGKASTYGYNHQYENRYPAWKEPNNLGDQGNYYYAQEN